MAIKSLDTKLAKIKADPSVKEFILADAKDADMAYGISAPGKSPEHHAAEGKFRTLADYRQCIRDVVHQGLVDIMLMSAHTNGILNVEERLFDDSHITPAARANDTTDIHVARGAVYAQYASQPFRTATIDQIQCGQCACTDEERKRGANLGLYSVTFNNDLERDRKILEEYKAFRLEAEAKGFRHFLEVFDPNALTNPIDPDKLGGFINDMIVRTLAGVPDSGRPIFLKVVYHGPKYTEELASYDPHLVLGILGGSSGTTYDAFKMISEAQKYGAKVALYGRKINNAEHQLAFIEMLRRIVDGQISPEEAVRAYHGILQAVGIRPYRSLDDDLQLTNQSMSYSNTSATTVPVGPPATGGGNGSKPASNGPSSDRPGQGDSRTVTPSATSQSNNGTGHGSKPGSNGDRLADSPSVRQVRPPRRSSVAPPASGEPSASAKPKPMTSSRWQPASNPTIILRPEPGTDGFPDFANMTPEERVAYHRERIRKL